MEQEVKKERGWSMEEHKFIVLIEPGWRKRRADAMGASTLSFVRRERLVRCP